MTTQPLKAIVLDLLRQGHLDEEAFLRELTEAERTAIGTPDLWSAKDHIAHLTFWGRKRIGTLTAILQHQELPSGEEDEEPTNMTVFEEYRQRPWSAIHAESEQAYAGLIKLVEQLSEEDLKTSRRFAAIAGDRPLYTVFLGPCYEHGQEHLAQYYSDRNVLTRASEILEKCVNRIRQAEVPGWVKGSFLYHLTCFYTQQNQLEKAAARLQEAVTLSPDLKERAQSDPELVPLRDHLA